MACILALQIIRKATHREPGMHWVSGYRVVALETAMAPYRGATLSFKAADGEPFDHWLFPRSPFAGLLMEAYAPHFPRDPYWTRPLWKTWGPDQRLLAQHWIEAVIQPFVESYQLVIDDDFGAGSHTLLP